MTDKHLVAEYGYPWSSDWIHDLVEYVPHRVLRRLATVFKYGATKNAGRWRFNWRDQENPGYAKNKRAAMGRHLVRHDCNELWDESGEPAIFHAAANLLIEADLDERIWNEED